MAFQGQLDNMEDNLEHLLKIAGGSDGIPQSAKAKDAGVFNFILSNGIVVGEHKIPQATVYKLYTNTVANPLPLKQFFKEFRKYFTQERTNTVRFYLLNRKPFGLPEDFSIYTKKFGFQKKFKRTKKVASSGDQEKKED
jgi:hypothetical protein